MPAESRMITTFSGRRMDPCNPRPEDFCVIDIAHALSLKCRFNGHCRFFYSVAQHSVLCAQVARRSGADARWALMHDAAEAYLCDVPRPVKSQLVGFDAIEQRLLTVLADWLDIPEPSPLPRAVELIDNQILSVEWPALMCGDSAVELPVLPVSSPLHDVVVVPWSLEEGKRRFIWMFNSLFGG